MLCREYPSEVVPVPRVRLGHEGLRDLAACAVSGDPVAAELVDADGEVCGRARRDAGREPMPWHVQLGGVLSSRRWAAVPMGGDRGSAPTGVEPGACCAGFFRFFYGVLIPFTEVIQWKIIQ